jgi:Na+/alanine symporter
MKQVLILVFFLFCFTTAFAWDDPKDNSLKYLLATAKNDSGRKKVHRKVIEFSGIVFPSYLCLSI